jgi:hypothetical protein
VFNILKAGNKPLIHPYDLMYESAFGAKHNDVDFETVTAVVLSQNF